MIANTLSQPNFYMYSWAKGNPLWLSYRSRYINIVTATTTYHKARYALTPNSHPPPNHSPIFTAFSRSHSANCLCPSLTNITSFSIDYVAHWRCLPWLKRLGSRHHHRLYILEESWGLWKAQLFVKRRPVLAGLFSLWALNSRSF
jgi:hypothetical protein